MGFGRQLGREAQAQAGWAGFYVDYAGLRRVAEAGRWGGGQLFEGRVAAELGKAERLAGGVVARCGAGPSVRRFAALNAAAVARCVARRAAAWPALPTPPLAALLRPHPALCALLRDAPPEPLALLPDSSDSDSTDSDSTDSDSTDSDSTDPDSSTPFRLTIDVQPPCEVRTRTPQEIR
jgi:hypothetical protein